MLTGGKKWFYTVVWAEYIWSIYLIYYGDECVVSAVVGHRE